MATDLSPQLAAELTTLRRQYFALVPPYLLRLPASRALASEAAQAFLVDRLLLDESIPQPEPGYLRGFWRRVLPVLEEGVGVLALQDEDAAVDERVYEVVAELMAVGGAVAGAPKQSYKTFIYDLPSGGEARVSLLEEQVAVQAGTTGLRTWTAALHLAHHILHSPRTIFGTDELPPVVELGAGTGFMSIVLAQLGVDVITTDLGDDDDDDELDEPAEVGERRTPLGRLRANIALNNLSTPPRAAALDWADASLAPQEQPSVWAEALAPSGPTKLRRAVLAADVIYDPDIVPLLVQAISVLLAGPASTRPPVAIIAATVRNEETFALFLERCATTGLHTELLPLKPMDGNAPTFWDTALDLGTRVEVVRITRGSS